MFHPVINYYLPFADTVLIPTSNSGYLHTSLAAIEQCQSPSLNHYSEREEQTVDSLKMRMMWTTRTVKRLGAHINTGDRFSKVVRHGVDLWKNG
jgi:hypothetical protein